MPLNDGVDSSGPGTYSKRTLSMDGRCTLLDRPFWGVGSALGLTCVMTEIRSWSTKRLLCFILLSKIGPITSPNVAT